MRNRGLASQETLQEHMSIVRQKISFQHQAPIRKTNTFSTCFYTSFLSLDFPFWIDSLHTYSYSHLYFHTRHLFTEIAYQVNKFLESLILGSYCFVLHVRSGALVRSEQVFDDIVGELLFIWKVRSFQVSILYQLFFDFINSCS